MPTGSGCSRAPLTRRPVLRNAQGVASHSCRKNKVGEKTKQKKEFQLFKKKKKNVDEESKWVSWNNRWKGTRGNPCDAIGPGCCATPWPGSSWPANSHAKFFWYSAVLMVIPSCVYMAVYIYIYVCVWCCASYSSTTTTTATIRIGRSFVFLFSRLPLNTFSLFLFLYEPLAVSSSSSSITYTHCWAYHLGLLGSDVYISNVYIYMLLASMQMALVLSSFYLDGRCTAQHRRYIQATWISGDGDWRKTLRWK